MTGRSIEREKTLDTPIFVVGPLRSGTTLLRILIGHHPSINMFGEFEGAVSQADGNDWPSLDKYYSFLENDRVMQSFNAPIDRSLNYVDLVKRLLAYKHDQKKRPMIGASVHSRIDLLPDIWPKAKFIHLLRDPRDVANSCIGMGWVGNVYEGAKYWIYTEEHWDILITKISVSQYITVRYENLVTEPEVELKKICHFLGVKYSPEMLDIEKDTTYSKPDAAFANQWKRKLNHKQISLVELQCKTLMEMRGYAISCEILKKPNVYELMKIKIQNKMHRVIFNIRRWGLILWLSHVIVKRTGPQKLANHIKRRINKITTNYLK